MRFTPARGSALRDIHVHVVVHVHALWVHVKLLSLQAIVERYCVNSRLLRLSEQRAAAASAAQTEELGHTGLQRHDAGQTDNAGGSGTAAGAATAGDTGNRRFTFT